MAESTQHIILVQKMYEWVCNNILNCDSGCVLVDLPEVCRDAKPPKVVNEFKPDLYAHEIGRDILIIGEAKTYDDLETRHSLFQYESYVMTCKLHSGKAYIIMAVPWQLEARAKNIIRRIIKKHNAENIELVVLKKLSV